MAPQATKGVETPTEPRPQGAVSLRVSTKFPMALRSSKDRETFSEPRPQAAVYASVSKNMTPSIHGIAGNALALFLIAAAFTFGQTTPAPVTQEEADLQQAMAETGGSPIEVIHALEAYLKKYPDATKRREIDRTLTKSAIEIRDDRRIVEYGERALKLDPDDLQILDRVTGALLQSQTTNPEKAARALVYAKRFEAIVLNVEKEKLERKDAARRLDEVDRGLSRALLFQARAQGTLGKLDEAISLARKSFDRYASENAAHEAGRWLAKAGRHLEAAEMFANALMVPDSRATETDRMDDRKSLGETWTKAKGSEAGLGDIILNAYDRTNALVAERNRKLKALDPNREVTNPYQYTISTLDGVPFKLADMKGKVLVLDFWATWCGPCRAQYPLYEEVKKRFKQREDVVFLAISADDDPSVVKPFLDQMKWHKDVYLDDGLARLMVVANIPATVVFDKQGQISSRMNGYLPDRFVDMLTERIQTALGDSQ